eukprot:9449404-Pyramimonas_sp.AAC.1
MARAMMLALAVMVARVGSVFLPMSEADLHAAKWAIDCAKDYADPRPPIFTQHGINTHMFLWGVTVINK